MNRVRRLVRIAFSAALVLSLAPSLGSQGRPETPFHGVVLHAHNCFPEDGRWTDWLDRALDTGVRPIAIEQDVAWYVDPATGQGRPVLSHGGTLTGTEPTLEDYFFTRVQPIVERALADGRRESWPVVLLHFNFRNPESALLQSIWDLLGRHEAWLTTATRGEDEATVMPLALGPMMVLTESGQEEAFYQRVRVGGRLRVFGTVAAGRAQASPSADREAQAAAVASTPAEVLIPRRATNYRRWINFPWGVVESGGQPGAGDWTSADATRLQALVDRAHDMGLWIRFYTLNGHAPVESQGWSAGYNFGSLEAARRRWRAAIDAGVDLLATDQYELLADILRGERPR